ncbi:MAG: hypothetical protein Q9225_004776 [Loekoesia sp. 1 TL-2023]
MTDATRQSDPLPSISYIELEKINRENSMYNSRIPSTSATNMPALPLASPSSMYSGPPPPYSYPSSTASSVIGGHTNGNGYISPSTEPRKTIDDEKDHQQAVRQSLPSIHEALNRDQPLSITSLLTKTSAPLPPSHQIHHSSNPSPTSPLGRSYKDSPITGPPATPARTRSSPVHSDALHRTHHSPRPTINTTSIQLPSSASRETHYPAMLPPRTIPSPAGVTRSSLPSSTLHHSSPTYDPGPRSAPMTNPQHTYASYPASYSYAPPMSTIPSSYQPPSPSNPPNWRYGEPDLDRTEDYRPNPMKEGMIKPTFGEAVKRHLDSFDLETSLNERSGPIPGSLPSLPECDEMMGFQKRVLDSMQRIKEVIIAQQHALAEQRNYEKYRPPSEADEDGASFHDKSEGSGGFAGADPKKRRGVR